MVSAQNSLVVKFRTPILIFFLLFSLGLVLLSSEMSASYDLSYSNAENLKGTVRSPQIILLEDFLGSNPFNDSFIAEIYHAVNLTSYMDYVSYLAESIGSRPFDSVNNLKARNWLLETLKNDSREKINANLFGNYNNVIGRLPANVSSNKLIIFGGHFDTVFDSPGADDNASGIAMMLEIARVLSQYGWEAEMWFVGFNAEENGLHGSYEIAQEVFTNNWDVLNVFTADMILNSDKIVVYSDRRIMNSWIWAYLVSIMSKTYGKGMVSPIQSILGASSDYWPFLEKHYNATLASELYLSKHWHKPSDTINQTEYNYQMATELTAATAAAAAFYLTYPARVIADSDSDGLLDIKEMILGTNIAVYDTDADGLSDGAEENVHHSDPLNPDTDADGLLDGEEVYHYHTNPLSSDSDVDGLPDFIEIILGTNPLSPDTDNDTLSDADEVLVYHTDPKNIDTDGDGLPDAVDIFKTEAIEIPLFLGIVGSIILALIVSIYFLVYKKR